MIRNSTVTSQRLFMKGIIVAVLLASSLQVLANCDADQAAGWRLFETCGANFDPNGNYVNSTCRDSGPPSMGETTSSTCMPATLSNGASGCSNSTCAWSPLND